MLVFQVNPRALTAQAVWGVGLTEAAGLSANECLKGIPIFAFASERPLKGHLIYIPHKMSQTRLPALTCSHILSCCWEDSHLLAPQNQSLHTQATWLLGLSSLLPALHHITLIDFIHLSRV